MSGGVAYAGGCPLSGVVRPFSISHSRTHAAIALGPEGEKYGLGIDIEYPRPRLAALAPRFTNAEDTQARDIDGLLHLWAGKEAAFKAAESCIPGSETPIYTDPNAKRPLVLSDIVVNLEDCVALLPDGRQMHLAFAHAAFPLPQLICLARP